MSRPLFDSLLLSWSAPAPGELDPTAKGFIGLLVIVLLPVIIAFTSGGLRQYSRSWQFLRLNRRLCRLRRGRIILRYSPELDYQRDMKALLGYCQEELTRLMDLFEDRLLGKVHIYLLATRKEVTELGDSPCEEFTLEFANTIVLSGNDFVEERIRSRLVPLFAVRWSWRAPPLLRMGMEMWLRQTWGNRPIERLSRFIIMMESDHELRQLLVGPMPPFMRNSENWYMLAGSFTGYLLRHYGWKRYRRLYRSCNGHRFDARFKKTFGAGLETVEAWWRLEQMLEQKALEDRTVFGEN